MPLTKEEVVRRVLPWMLIPRFKNVLLSVREIEKYGARKAYVTTSPVVVNEVSSVFIPGASSFLVVPRVDYESEETDDGRLRVSVVDGFIHGFLPDGKYAKFLVKTVIGDEPIDVHYKGTYTGVALDTVIRSYLRVRTGPLFAYKVALFCKNNSVDIKKLQGGKYGVDAGTETEVYIGESSLYAVISMPINLYSMKYGGTRITAPGIVPGLLELIRRGVFEPVKEPEARQAVKDFLKEVAEIGSSVMPISSATIQRISKSKFTYIIGEADGPDTVFEQIRKTLGNRKLFWITSTPAYRGTRLSFYLNPDSRKIYMTISLLPFNPPATAVLNYPPFNIAPLAALMNQRVRLLRYNLDKVSRYLSKRGIEAGFYDMDYEPLGEAGITFDEVRQVLRDGYPRLEHLRPLLEKAEKLGYIGDIMSHAYGKESRIDEILIKELKSIAGQKEKKQHVAKQEKTAEEETEEVLL